MANLSKIKRDKMIQFLETLKKKHTDDDSIRAFNEIVNNRDGIVKPNISNTIKSI